MARSRSRSRSRERRRRSRSRSNERRRDRSRERERGRDRDRRRRSKERSRSRSPLERRRSRSRDRDYHDKDYKRRKDSPRRKDKKSEKPIDLQSLANTEQEMMAAMGFGGFDTTKNKKVEGNYEGSAKVNKQRRYRQYMNRKGGFNRPLEYMA